MLRKILPVLVLVVLFTTSGFAQPLETPKMKDISTLQYYLLKFFRTFQVYRGSYYCDADANKYVDLYDPALKADCTKCAGAKAAGYCERWYRDGTLIFESCFADDDWECTYYGKSCGSSFIVYGIWKPNVGYLCDNYGPGHYKVVVQALSCPDMSCVMDEDIQEFDIYKKEEEEAPPEQPPEEEEEQPPAKCEPKIVSAGVDKSYAKEGDIVTITAVVQNTGSATCSKILVEGSLLPCEEDPAGCSYRQTIMAIEAPPGSLCCPGNENYADAYIYNLAPNAKETVYLKVKAPAKGTYDACNPNRHFGTDHYWYAKVGIYPDCGKPAYDYRKVGIVRKVVPEEPGSNEGQTDTGEKVTTCSSDADCPSGYVCSQGRCVESGKECTTSDDCERWEICEEGKCVIPKELYLLLAILLIGSIRAKQRQPVVVVGK